MDNKLTPILGVGERVYGTKRDRMLITNIDTIMALFKDYCKGYIPNDAMPLTLQLSKLEPGKMAILAESDHWDTKAEEVVVRFELKRVYGTN